LLKNDIPAPSPEKLELGKTPPRTVSFLTPEEITKLIKAAQDEKNPLVRQRNLAIIHVLFGSGLRVSELTNLQKSNLNLPSNQFWIIGKGNKARAAFLTKDAIQALEKYFELRQDDSPYVFVSHSNNSAGKPLTRVMVESIVRNLARKA